VNPSFVKKAGDSSNDQLIGSTSPFGPQYVHAIWKVRGEELSWDNDLLEKLSRPFAAFSVSKTCAVWECLAGRSKDWCDWRAEGWFLQGGEAMDSFMTKTT
jgi:hypothetical protein